MPSNLDRYDRIYYKNNTSPPINQKNLNKMEDGISTNRDAIIALQNQQTGESSPFSVVNGEVNITYET